MRAFKLIETETKESRNVFNFSDGTVTVVECETLEIYRIEASATRLVIDEAIERTKNFVAKSRSEIAGLNAVLQDLTAK